MPEPGDVLREVADDRDTHDHSRGRGREPGGAAIASLSAFDLSCVVIGGIIGVGIFFTPAKVAAAVDSPAQMIAAWCLGGAFAAIGAFVFADLARRVHGHGGTFIYIHAAFGAWPAFLYGWANWLVIQSGALGVIGMILVDYLDIVVFGAPRTSMDAKIAITAFLIALFTGVNMLGLRVGKRVQNTLTVTKTALIFALVALALLAQPADPAPARAPAAGRPLHLVLAAALLPVLFSFGGWQQGAFVAGAARRPRRDVPLGILGGVAVVVLAYVTVNLAFLDLLGFERAASTNTIAEDAARVGLAQHGLGEIAGRAISAAVVVSALGILNTILMAPPYVLHAMAQRGVFFAAAGRLHPRTGAPTLGVLLQGTWGIALLLGTYACARSSTFDTLDSLLQGIVFVDWVFYGGCALSLWVLRRRVGERGSIAAVLFGVASLAVTAGAIWTSPLPSLVGLALVALGVPLFAAARRRARVL